MRTHVSPMQDRRVFHATAGRTRSINTGSFHMRGGIRL